MSDFNTSSQKKNPSSRAEKEKGILLDAGTNEVEFLKFHLDNQCFGVNVAKVIQIVAWREIKHTRVPEQHPSLIGTALFREHTIPVYDLRKLLGRPEQSVSFEGRIDTRLLLVCHFNRKTYGFLVDSVSGIDRVSWNQFAPMTQDTYFAETQSVVGTVVLDDQLIMILDFEAIMSMVDPDVSAERFSDNLSGNSTFDRSKVKVLYCEDSPTVRKIALDVLLKAGFSDVVTMKNGLDGWKFLNTEPGKEIDVLVTDIEMPQMDGLTLCKTLKAKPEFAKLPVIFFSSLVSEEMKIKCQSVNGDAYFSKPEVHLVATAIDQLVQKSA